MGKVATSPLPSRGAPPLQSRGLNQNSPTNGQGGYITPAVSGSPPLHTGKLTQKWPINEQGGYITPANSGSPSAPEQGTQSEVAHKWAMWLHNPYRLRGPLHFRGGD